MKIDRMTSGVLDFEVGTSSFTCSTQLFPYQRVQIIGTAGRVEIEIPFNAPPDVETRLWLHTIEGTEERTFPICNQFKLQGDIFSKAIIEGSPVPTPLSDAIENMTVIDSLFESATRSAWVTL